MLKEKNFFQKWFPVLFLILVWYVPRNTAPEGFFENYIILRWVTFIIIPIIIILYLIYKYHINSQIITGNISLPLISIFFTIIISAFINNSSVFETGFTLSLYLRYPLLFLFFLNLNLNEISLKTFLTFFFFLVIIQIPETYYRFFVLGIKKDRISYTLGVWGHFDLGIYMLYATSLLIAKSLIVKFRIIYAIIIICFFGISVIGEIKAYTLSAPVVSLFIIYSCMGLKIPIKRLYYIILIFLCVFVATYLAVISYEIVFPKEPTFDSLRDGAIPGTDSAAYNRISPFFNIFSSINISLKNYIFGWGPGSSLAGTYTGQSGLYYDLGITFKTQLAETFIDIGFLGLVVYFWLLSKLCHRFKAHYKIEYNNSYLYLNRAIMGMLLFYGLLGPYYDLIWRHDSSGYIIFFLSSVIYCRYIKLKKVNT